MADIGDVDRDGEREGLTRRQVLVGAGAVAGSLMLPHGLARAKSGFELPEATKQALSESSLVYISPLLAGGAESTCHGEVWYFVDEGGVVIYTGDDRWKARAIRRGRNEARIWVGDFGPVGRAGDRYRAAPTFVARAELSRDQALFDRLMASYAQRYADEWGKWGPRFEKGWADKSRVMIRYRPAKA